MFTQRGEEILDLWQKGSQFPFPLGFRSEGGVHIGWKMDGGREKGMEERREEEEEEGGEVECRPQYLSVYSSIFVRIKVVFRFVKWAQWIKGTCVLNTAQK